MSKVCFPCIVRIVFGVELTTLVRITYLYTDFHQIFSYFGLSKLSAATERSTSIMNYEQLAGLRYNTCTFTNYDTLAGF